MRLKDKVRIRQEDKTFIEVPGVVMPFKYNSLEINLILHESIQPWSPNVLDVSEESTGCLCASTKLPVAVATKKDAEKAMNDLIDFKGVNAFKKAMVLRKKEVQ